MCKSFLSVGRATQRGLAPKRATAGWRRSASEQSETALLVQRPLLLPLSAPCLPPLTPAPPGATAGGLQLLRQQQQGSSGRRGWPSEAASVVAGSAAPAAVCSAAGNKLQACSCTQETLWHAAPRPRVPAGCPRLGLPPLIPPWPATVVPASGSGTHPRHTPCPAQAQTHTPPAVWSSNVKGTC